MSNKTTWWHTHCLTPGRGTPIWYDPTWVIDTCELCEMDIDTQDWWSGVCYNASQRKLFDDIKNAIGTC